MGGLFKLENEHHVAYRGLLAQPIEGKLLEDIRQATNKRR